MFRYHRILLTFFLVASLLLAICGCGKIQPTAPEREGAGAPLAQPPKSGLPTNVLWPRLMIDCDTVYHVARVYEDKDNYIRLILPGWYNYFVVPEGAVREDVTITIAVTRYHYWDEQTGQTNLVAFFDFGPDGLTFGNDNDEKEYGHDWYWGYHGWHSEDGPLPYLYLHGSWLDLHYGDRAVLRYYNEDTGLWEEISSTTVRYGRIKFYFEHFSKYAISR